MNAPSECAIFHMNAPSLICMRHVLYMNEPCPYTNEPCRMYERKSLDLWGGLVVYALQILRSFLQMNLPKFGLLFKIDCVLQWPCCIRSLNSQVSFAKEPYNNRAPCKTRDCVAVSSSVLQWVVRHARLGLSRRGECRGEFCSLLQLVAACCSVLQYTAVCCNVPCEAGHVSQESM